MLKILEDNTIDLEVLEISDIVDINILQKFQDNFAIGMNLASVTVDKNGTPITKPSSYTRFCECFIHQSPKGDAGCAMSHHKMGEEATRLGRPYIGTCHAGLIDFAAPILLDGYLLGTILGGQILDKAPNETFYRSIASQLDLDPDGLAEASNQIDIVSMRNIEAAANVLFIVINSLVDNGYQKIKLEITCRQLSTSFMQISTTLEELSASAVGITNQQEELNKEISQIVCVTSEINKILDAIKRIADQTKMLGLNASIEAARAGEVGRGFGVVANEIKNLSDTSKKTANLITQLTSQIQSSIASTQKNSHITLQTTQEQSDALESLNMSVQDMVSLCDQLTKSFNK